MLFNKKCTSSMSRLLRNNTSNVNSLVCSSFRGKNISTQVTASLKKSDYLRCIGGSGNLMNRIVSFSTTSVDRSFGWTLEREESLEKILIGTDVIDNSRISNDQLEKEMKVIIAALASQNRYDEILHWIDKMSQYLKKQNTGVDSIIGSAQSQMIVPAPSEMAISSLVAASKKCDSEEESVYYMLQADLIMKEYLKSYSIQSSTDQNRLITSKMVQKLYGDLILGWSNCKYEQTSYQPKSRKSNICREKRSFAIMSKFDKIVPAANAENWLRLAVTHAKQQKSSLYNEKGLANNSNSSVHQIRGPSSIMFGAVIDAHAKSRAPYAAQSAESVLSFLLDLREEDKMWPRPNAVMYTSVIDAWSRSPHVDFAVKSVGMWLDCMEREYDAGNIQAKPSVIAYSAAIMTFSRTSGRDENSYDKKSTLPNHAILAEQCLFRLFRRNRKILATMSRKAKDDSELMALLDEHIVHPDINVINGVINCWARQVRNGQNQEKNFHYAFNAESWLMLLLNCSEMQPVMHMTEDEIDPRSYENNNLDPELEKKLMIPSITASGIVPDIVSFNSVINAYAGIKNSRAAALKVDQLFNMMKDYALEPTSITYGSAIKSWGNTNSSEGAERATMYLHEYESAGRNGLIQPNVVAYNAALNAWAGSSRIDALDKMHSIIERMEIVLKDGSNKENDNAALVAPDIVSYNTLLKACMNHENKNRAFQLTLEIFHNKIFKEQSDRRITFEPDLNTFATIFACIRNCIPEKRKQDDSYLKLCQKVFDCCCQLGMVDKYVLSSLQSALPERNDFNSMLLGAGIRNGNDVPLSLKMNARKRRSLKMNFGRSQHGAATKSAAYRSQQLKHSSRTRMKR